MPSTAPRRVLARMLVAALAVFAVSCGSAEDESVFVVGAGDSAESRVLAEIYAGALARTGLPVRVRTGLGDRAGTLAALDAGAVGLVGEHTGALLAAFDGTAEATTPAEVGTALNRSLPEGVVVADPAESADLRPRLLVEPVAARRDGLDSVRALIPRCPATTAGVATVPGLLPPGAAIRVAGCEFAAVTSFPSPEALVQALRTGVVGVGVLTGPPELVPAAEGLTVLADEDFAVRAENVVPLLRKGVLDDQRTRKLNYVAGELTTAELVELVRAVGTGSAPAESARDWLDAHGL
ncbi:glycine betaine ABC transporter substrate-binding protein [Nocardia farcinica]|uniref:glycine betaine ABC transporter substrate-binding protein n=1 Tax=Nocardia farcinica TaxID=37329 RepID=UPI002456EBB8|nr:glycine betaine ABC transporter substrate-binding protein [Nocardia farcinica]